VDWFILIIGFGREKDNVSNEWMIQLYFASLRSESKVQKIVGLPHVNVVYTKSCYYLYI
jgi:hypothetical protein